MTEEQTLVVPNFPNFDDIKVSTRTFIAMTNLALELDQLFLKLPVTTIDNLTVVDKRKPRKKTEDQSEPFYSKVPVGSIISLELESEVRGLKFVKKRKKRTRSFKRNDHWRNSVTAIMVLNDKTINIKICKNGKFQMTGCILDSHPIDCIKYMWTHILSVPNLHTFSYGSCLETIFIPAMRNIDFNMGFHVDREKLAHYMSTQTEFHSLLETSFGYTGCNIKVPISDDVVKMSLTKLIFNIPNSLEPTIMTMSYSSYLDMLPNKDRSKKLSKDRYNTFLVFHSGKVIMSGLTADLMRNTYADFVKIISTCYPLIKETLDS